MRLAMVWPLSGRPQVRCRADHAKRNPNVVGITMFRLALHHSASADSISRTRMRCQYSRACRSGDIVGVDSAGDSSPLRRTRAISATTRESCL
jgi:hypothetical protein